MFHFWPQSIEVRVVGFLGTTVNPEGLAIEVFPFDDSGAGAYPPAPLRTVMADADGTFDFAVDDVPPGGLYVRADAPEHGIAAAFVGTQREGTRLELGVPVRLVGQVVDSSGKPIAGAHVAALPHKYGPLLGSATTDAEGSFAIDRLSSSSGFFAVRVLMPGYALFQDDMERREGEAMSITLHRSRPVEGRVEVPPEAAREGLVVRAHRCPGVEARVGVDGAFRLDCVPAPPLKARLLVHGLAPGWTHRTVLAESGDEGLVVEAEPEARVRGVVVTADRDMPVPRAYVHHPHGPAGGAGVYADEDGRFELGGVPSGRVRLDAFGGKPRLERVEGEPDRMQVPFGFVEVEAAPGQILEKIVVRVH